MNEVKKSRKTKISLMVCYIVCWITLQWVILSSTIFPYAFSRLNAIYYNINSLLTEMSLQVKQLSPVLIIMR